MKKIRFIYNPVSGNGILKTRLDEIIERFQRSGFQVVPHRLLGKSDVKNAFLNFEPEDYSAVVVSGGDGTVHDIVNQIKIRNINLPLGIIPSGTSNDFATFLGIPKDIKAAIDIILEGKTDLVDIGKTNNKYFINVVAGGILPSIGHKAKKDLKNTFGMFAYYIKAIEEIPNIKPFSISIITENNQVTEDVLMFLILNTSIAGGFKIAPDAKVNDGLLDVCLIKNCTIAEFASLFIKVLKGEHINDEKLIFMQTKKLYISSNDKIETDVDGEANHDVPLEIEIAPSAIRVFK